MNRAGFVLLILAVACAQAAEPPFDAAESAVANLKLAKARELFREAQQKDADPERRDKAAIGLSKIDWRAYHDATAGRKDLALVDPAGKQSVNALIERARIEAELAGDLTAARRAATQAVERATRRDDRSRAIAVRARIEVDAGRRDRLAGHCTESAPLRSAAADLRALIERDGPRHENVQLLLGASLMTGDMPAALQAWRWYYGSAPAIDAGDRRALGMALANAKFFTEAALVLRDPCAKEPVAVDAEIADVLAYEASLRHIREIAEEYYRKVAIGEGDTAAFQKTLDKEGRALWDRLSFPAARPAYSQKALAADLDRRFGAVITLGTSSNVFNLHFGHRVIDEQREVSQYGRRAMLRFVALDGIVSNGFWTWMRDGSGGDGGWAAAGVIYQVRPMYADGPVLLWLRTADPELRAKQDREMAEETKRDVERAAATPIRYFPGLTMRLERQYADALAAALRAEGLSDDALRDAFIAKARRDTFESSIWAHEGRHAIDQKEGIKDSAELEFRAKLSEVALATAPRSALVGGIITGGIGSDTPHGRANKRAAEGAVAWMRAHAGEIVALDAAAPLLPQLDKLTDEQLRAAFRAMDPFAAPP